MHTECMEANRQELLEEIMSVEALIKENPCGMSDGLIGALKEVLHSFIGNHCIEGASKEQVALYFNKDIRTITNWQKRFDDFPKGKKIGYMEKSFNWMDIIHWKLRHRELFAGI